MKIAELKQLLIDHKIYNHENEKNFITKCIFCGDHPNLSKQKHLYISKDPEVPLYRCFFCNTSGTIYKLVFSLTGSKKETEKIITKQELFESSKNLNNIQLNAKTKNVRLPDLEIDNFSNKIKYLESRLSKGFDINILKQNIVFDIKQFIEINKIDSDPKFIDFLHNNMIGFLTKHQSMLICRNIDSKSKFKFHKLVIQNIDTNLLDYISFDMNESSNTIVLSEGIFDILNPISQDIMRLNNDVLLYASGQSFCYEAMLKSICFDKSLYNGVNVIIYSDSDKPKYCYNKFIRNTKHIIGSLKIYYNKNKKDFGMNPIIPVSI